MPATREQILLKVASVLFSLTIIVGLYFFFTYDQLEGDANRNSKGFRYLSAFASRRQKAHQQENSHKNHQRLDAYQILCNRKSKQCDEDSAELYDFELRRDEHFTDLRRILLVVHLRSVRNYMLAARFHAIYARLFGKIVYCGPDETRYNVFWPTFKKTRVLYPLFAVPKETRFYAIGEHVHRPGENCYACIDEVMRDHADKFEPYDGIMLVADDVALNYWTWTKQIGDLSKNWMLKDNSKQWSFDVDEIPLCFDVAQQSSFDCLTIGQPEIRQANANFTDDLELLANMPTNDSTPNTKFYQDILFSLTAATGGRRRLARGFGDVFYIAKKYIDTVLPLFRLFNKHRVLCEFAVPTTLRAVTQDHSDDLLAIDSSGLYVAEPDQITMGDIYSPNMTLVHPFQLQQVFKNESLLQSLQIGRYQVLYPWLVSKLTDSDPTIDCVYCFLRNMSIKYADKFYSTRI